MVLSTDEIYAIVGNLIQTTREEARMTQDELARRVGLSRTSISNIEHGRQRIQVHILWTMASALGVPAQQLLPTPSMNAQTAFQGDLPNEFLPAERDWVERVLTEKRR